MDRSQHDTTNVVVDDAMAQLNELGVFHLSRWFGYHRVYQYLQDDIIGCLIGLYEEEELMV